MKKFRKMLIALDQSEHSNNIIRYGGTLAARYKADLILLHVLSSKMRYEDDVVNEDSNNILPSPSISVKSAEAAYLQAYKWLEAMALTTSNNNINIKIEVLIALDSISAEILTYIEKNEIDLIVVGTKEKTGTERVLLGSVASHIVTHARCPVLVVR
jgi:nucleotide-binding universal stress UspA family protein